MSNQMVAVELFIHPDRIEVRQRDPAVHAGGRKLGLAEDVGDHWRVYPDLTDCPRVRASVDGARVRDVPDALAAEAVLRDAWEVS